MDMQLELLEISVTDVNRASEFYKVKICFDLDYYHIVYKSLRFVRIRPLGSACSICFGIGSVDNMKPGSSKGLQMQSRMF